jgi:TetR/AcrR family transcriptional repressor of nem operon
MIVDTRQLILDKSEVLVRTRGYTAFSYGDLAADLGVTKASVHYHFATKEDLVLAIFTRCITRSRAALAQMKQDHTDARDRLRAYANSFLFSVESGMMPVCGALAAERMVLPESSYPLIREFFQMQIDWLTGVIAEGVDAGVIAPPQPPEQAAMVVFSALEGGTMIAWGMDRTSMVLTAFEAVLDCMQTQVSQTPATVGKPAQGSQGAARRRPSRSAAQAGGPLK